MRMMTVHDDTNNNDSNCNYDDARVASELLAATWEFADPSWASLSNEQLPPSVILERLRRSAAESKTQAQRAPLDPPLG